MGVFKPYTAAERRRMDKDQQDPRWLAWLANMDEQLGRFLTETVPDMPADPWTAEGLRHAEQAALEHFPASESVDLPENSELADRFHRFVGEVFRRNFEGDWYNVPNFDDDNKTHGFGPVVRRPFNELYLTVIPQLTVAMSRRSGKEWSQVFEYSREDYDEWQAAGRPPMLEWIKIRDAD